MLTDSQAILAAVDGSLNEHRGQVGEPQVRTRSTRTSNAAIMLAPDSDSRRQYARQDSNLRPAD